MNAVLRSFWAQLPARRQRQFVLLCALMVASGLAEAISLGAVVPFLAALAAPESLLSHRLLGDMLRRMGIAGTSELRLAMTAIFMATAILAGGLRLAVLRCVSGFALGAAAELGAQIFRRSLFQPYLDHVGRNTSEVISSVTHKIDTLAYGVLQAGLTFLASCALIAAVVPALLAIQPTVALASMAFFGAAYLLIARFNRRHAGMNGAVIEHEYARIVKVVQEGLGGIRDILLDGTQETYSRIHESAERRMRAAIARNLFLAQSPRFLMESIGLVLIAAIAYGSALAGELAAMLPVLGALALAAQRLLPALQQGYASWLGLMSSRAALDDVLLHLSRELPDSAQDPAPHRLSFHESIALTDVRFRYPGGPVALDGITLHIAKGMKIGIVGRSGSGKSTLTDVLMGLLPPTQGRLAIDGIPLGDDRSMRAWQLNVAHVPQSIFLADASISENIAFGSEAGDIDLERVREAARKAQIHDFIESLPRGYDTSVGENGVRLSGGQRQRLGIARALYKRAPVIVFDEATAALDAQTEASLLNAIHSMGNDQTIVLVTHRLSALRHCDMVVRLEAGRIASLGPASGFLDVREQENARA